MRSEAAAGMLLETLMGSTYEDFKNTVQTREFEELLNRGLGVNQYQLALPAQGQLVQANQRPKPATVHKCRLRQVHLDVAMAVEQRTPHPLAEGSGIGFCQLLH